MCVCVCVGRGAMDIFTELLKKSGAISVIND